MGEGTSGSQVQMTGSSFRSAYHPETLVGKSFLVAERNSVVLAHGEVHVGDLRLLQ